MKTFFAILLTCITVNIFAQNSEADIKAIRDYYSQLKNDMKAASAAEYSPFYVTKTEENLHKSSMPAVGTYFGTIEKWFIANVEDGSFGTDGILVYKTSNFTISDRMEYREYVFKDGKLIFCFIKGDGVETRYYYKNDKLLDFKEKIGEGGNAYYTKDDWSGILENATK